MVWPDGGPDDLAIVFPAPHTEADVRRMVQEAIRGEGLTMLSLSPFPKD